MLAAKAMGADAIIMIGKMFIEFVYFNIIFKKTKISVNLDLTLPRKLELLMLCLLMLIHKKQLNWW
jgi:hypothetical protein